MFVGKEKRKRVSVSTILIVYICRRNKAPGMFCKVDKETALLMVHAGQLHVLFLQELPAPGERLFPHQGTHMPTVVQCITCA